MGRTRNPTCASIRPEEPCGVALEATREKLRAVIESLRSDGSA